MSNGALVQISDLTKTFDISSPWLERVIERKPRQYLTAVEEVSFEIERGTTYALVGESGSGKSTIARMLVGLMKPTRGSVHVDGVNPDSASAEDVLKFRRQIQMIFQDPYASMNPRWRVSEIVAEPIVTLGLLSGRDAVVRRVGELLEQVGLSARDAGRFPHEFSGGQRQRICIARALASNPEFIVCDEPTSALDVSVQAQVLNLMRDLQRDLKLTYLFITHDLAVVRYMADQIGVLYLGRLVESAARDRLFSAPSHPYTQMLLDAAPRLDGFGRQHQSDSSEIPDPINRPSGCHFHPRCSRAKSNCAVESPQTQTAGASRVACFYPS